MTTVECYKIFILYTLKPSHSARRSLKRNIILILAKQQNKRKDKPSFYFALGAIRTRDLSLKRGVLYLLSYKRILRYLFYSGFDWSFNLFCVLPYRLARINNSIKNKILCQHLNLNFTFLIYLQIFFLCYHNITICKIYLLNFCNLAKKNFYRSFNISFEHIKGVEVK